ncbi:RluA family pseudouridine synthase [Peptoniphilus asaccharolyticus]
MQTILINKNDAGQRIDRFLKKYFEKANLSFIYKNLRKKNIVVNKKKVVPEFILSEGDKIDLFLSDDTIKKFQTGEKELRRGKNYPIVIYEDENIILMNKPAGILSHNDSKVFEKNMVDMMVDYLIAGGEYVPRVENSFRPAICNRLDRNTSGIIIGAKNANSLRIINDAIKKHNVDKFYTTLVYGEVKADFEDVSKLVKDEKNNKVRVSKTEGKDSITEFSVVKSEEYSLLSVKLITGRTHQIRTVLKSKGFPIVGDIKYGNERINRKFLEKYGYKSQFLHNNKIVFGNLEGDLSYLKGKIFEVDLPEKESKIVKDIFGD